MLIVEDLTKTYAGCDTPTIRGVAFEVRAGEAMVLVGPSGCGKTTTLRTVMGFETADRGRITHEGRVLLERDGGRGKWWRRGGHSLPPERRGLGFVFQDYALFPPPLGAAERGLRRAGCPRSASASTGSRVPLGGGADGL